MSGEDAETIATTWPGADRLNKVWRDALDTLIREKQAEAWDEGWRNRASRALDGSSASRAADPPSGLNPYRSQKTQPTPTAEETPE